MKSRFDLAALLFVCLVLISAVPVTALALTNRPVQHDDQGNFVPNEFAEGDALRYGGLFGPLQPPDPWEIASIGFKNPELVSPPDARNMGFAVDEGHFIPINRRIQID